MGRLFSHVPSRLLGLSLAVTAVVVLCNKFDLMDSWTREMGTRVAKVEDGSGAYHDTFFDERRLESTPGRSPDC
jgi:hypothetical protein